MSKKVLGKGLSAIISSVQASENDLQTNKTGIITEDSKEKIIELDIDRILPNPDQPRTHFNEEKIIELAESIKSTGLIQPITVRKEGDIYFLVAGERRLRASKLAGFKKIKSIILHSNRDDNLTIALIENLQREDLDPIEEAKAFKILITRFKLKQQEIAEKVGKDRASIANSIRLLNLDEKIQRALSEGKISVGHAKVLLGADEAKQFKIFSEIINNGLSVREAEKFINFEKSSQVKSKIKSKSKDAHIKKMEEKLISILGTKVEIKHFGKNGRIEINYYSIDDFDRIMEILKK
ncbi:MAG: ParB/RepB/Spo0J family partition protein [Spirochaetes bacterium]|nr:ParB/RepB/Spo0J family partition protein [Spirochaetota bacterium]